MRVRITFAGWRVCVSSAQRERSEHAELCAAVGERLQAAEAHYAALTERHEGRLHAAHARWGDCMRRRARSTGSLHQAPV